MVDSIARPFQHIKNHAIHCPHTILQNATTQPQMHDWDVVWSHGGNTWAYCLEWCQMDSIWVVISRISSSFQSWSTLSHSFTWSQAHITSRPGRIEIPNTPWIMRLSLGTCIPLTSRPNRVRSKYPHAENLIIWIYIVRSLWDTIVNTIKISLFSIVSYPTNWIDDFMAGEENFKGMKCCYVRSSNWSQTCRNCFERRFECFI